MPNWKSRYSAGMVLLAALSTIAAALVLPEDARKVVWEVLWQRTWPVPVGLIVVVLPLVLFFCLCAIIDEITTERHKRRNVEQLKEAALQQLRNSERMRQIDVVTRIPNQFKLEADLKVRTDKMSSDDGYQLVMLDLEGFGKVNEIFGYQRGDDLIEYIAQSIYQSMRRDEEAYKRPLAGNITSDDLWRRIYRKYSGGDEFVFVLSGNEAEALGFLLRQKRHFDDDFRKHIERNILKATWHLQFHAGVCPLYHDDTFESAMVRVEDCLRTAKQKGSKSRVYWYSRRTHADFPERGREMQVYHDAEKAFSVSS